MLLWQMVTICETGEILAAPCDTWFKVIEVVWEEAEMLCPGFKNSWSTAFTAGSERSTGSVCGKGAT